MDLTLQVTDNSKLNIRVAVIIETENGFVLSKSSHGSYLFAIGGRAKIGESSIQSAVRELEEETGLQISTSDFKLISIVENFWDAPVDNILWKIHEINFVFTIPKQKSVGLGTDKEFAGLVEMKKEEIKDLDIRPEVIKKIILEDKLNSFNHFIV
jgi:8-oxo-dGTP pyrophosphatase MutT (NUDIX family)